MGKGKKIFSLMVVICIFLGLISGCGAPEEETLEEYENFLTPISQTMNDLNADKVVTEPNFEIDKGVSESETEFILSPIFSDNMLLQANMAVRIWGKCLTEGSIAVLVGGKPYFGTVLNGEFELFIGKTDYTKSTTLTIINAKAKKTYSNVAFGELFLGTGQSNMGWTMNQCEIYANEIAQSANADIRLNKVLPAVADQPLNELEEKSTSGWSEATPSVVANFGAVAYFFAKEINAQYDVPVGILMSCMGGTTIVTWLDEQAYTEADKTYSTDDPESEAYPNWTGTKRYNAMIHPIRKLTCRGALWYQGENQPVNYEKNLRLLINCWRRVFDNQSFYFAIVQLPRYEDAEKYFLVREQQKNVAVSTEYATYSCNIDCGMMASEAEGKPQNPLGIHPFDKEPVGRRLAHAVMLDLYGAKGIYRGPELEKIRIKDGKVHITLKNCGTGLEIRGLGAGFEVAGEDGVFYDAKPEIVSPRTIALTCEEVKEVKTVRYGYSNESRFILKLTKFGDCVSVYNKEGYPMEQFLAEI